MMWWDSELRSPHDALGGVKMLAREIDKVRAELTGSLSLQLDENEALLDEVFFSSLGISKETLADVVRTAWVQCQGRNEEALIDLRESVENEPELSDAEFMTQAQASDVDHAAVRWLFGTLGMTTEAIEAINRRVDRILPSG
jgi:Domain of unknown function (DUF5069)